MAPRAFLSAFLAAALVFVLGYLCLFAWLPGAPIAAEYWLHGTRLVKLRLAESAPPPRLIFFGGSSTLFGIDAAAIERDIGQSTLNLGLHAGLPLDYHLDFARQVMRRGDTIVIVPEYGYFRTEQPVTAWFIDQVFAWDGDYLRRSGWWPRIDFVISTPLRQVINATLARLQAPRILARVPERAVPTEARVMEVYDAGWRSSQANPPSRHAFQYYYNNLDGNGDILNTVGTDNPPPQDYGMTAPLPPAPVVWRRLQDFSRDCEKHGVRLMLGFAPMMDSADVGTHRDTVLANLHTLVVTARAHGLGFIEEPADVLYAPALFFDTNFHLNDEGKRLRARRLASHWRALPR